MKRNKLIAFHMVFLALMGLQIYIIAHLAIGIVAGSLDLSPKVVLTTLGLLGLGYVIMWAFMRTERRSTRESR